MNTVKIGNDFEDKSCKIIENALNNKDLGLIPENCKVYRKKGYYSSRRKKDIIFDLSIEVTPAKADKPTLLYLIECKKYSSTIPVDDVALFAKYISEINDYAIKGVFITNNKLQSGAIEEITSHGIMLIEVDDENYNIIHYKNEKQKNQTEDFDSVIINAIQKSLLPDNIEGLRRLSAKQIDEIASNFINDFRPEILNYGSAIPLFDLLKHLEQKDSLKFKYSLIKDDKKNDILGYFNSEINEIILNKSIKNTQREPFVLAHELGHYVLHKELKVNKTLYNNFKDTSFNFFEQNYVLNNPKNWVEWQANCFASCLLMPEKSFKAVLYVIQKNMGISKAGRIFLDSQDCNKIAHRDIIDRLALHFNVSKVSVDYRLNDLKLTDRPTIKNDSDGEKEFLRKLSILNSKNKW